MVLPLKIDYKGFEIRRTGVPKVWRMTRPDGSWVFLKPHGDWLFEDEEEDLMMYIEMQADLMVIEEDFADETLCFFCGKKGTPGSGCRDCSKGEEAGDE